MERQQSILQHYEKSEHNFVRFCLTLEKDVTINGRIRITDFLSVREQHILTAVIGTGAQIQFYDGNDDCERKLAIVLPYNPDYYPDPPIKVLKIKYHHKFGTLQHSDVLGAILGLGLERKVLGDIIVEQHEIFVVVHENIVRYLQENLTQIGRMSVKVVIYDGVVPIKTEETLSEKLIHVTSLRLDSLLSHAYHFNREQAKEMIMKELVQINWVATKNFNQPYAVGDVISVRRYGRIYIDEVQLKQNGRFKIKIRMT